MTADGLKSTEYYSRACGRRGRALSFLSRCLAALAALTGRAAQAMDLRINDVHDSRVRG